MLKFTSVVCVVLIFAVASAIATTEGILTSAEVPQPDTAEYLAPCVELLDPIVQTMNSDGKSCDLLSQYGAAVLSSECLAAYDHAPQQYGTMCTRLVEELNKLECTVAVNCEDPHASADNNLTSGAGVQHVSVYAGVWFAVYTVACTVVW